MAVCGDTYYAGLWRTKLVQQLCWYVGTPQPRPNCGYRAPYWSWASVDGGVYLTAVEPAISYWADVVDVKVDIKTDDCTVSITGGSLKVRGCIFGVEYDRYTTEEIAGQHRIAFDGKCWLRVYLFQTQ
ncbi:hypothetical protein CMUS01_06161 [Colletotrichum musicola]|uniref:Uncharacterized protein n=1 Tax=Colletotrichum musicola TaxID=2175873 RepID=A0A8H6NIA6_9PEZI|nr:hypothetical protein CMUS01_06161 [Colletotrichum musicola]